MKRRQFLTWITRVAGSYFGLAAAGSAVPHLLRINSVRLGEAEAQVPEPCVCETNDDCLCEGSDIADPCPADGGSDPCSPDTCTTLDHCGAGDNSVQCLVSDVCDQDTSGDCRIDNCTDDSSGTCRSDNCTADSSGNCTSDICVSDSSGACTADNCPASDSSDLCLSDECTVSDSSGQCVSDSCNSDSSGSCVSDQCTSDSSGSGDPNLPDLCRNDQCNVDSSGNCRTDNCTSDSAGSCISDQCTSDSSGYCTADTCVNDSSEACMADNCSDDTNGECIGDDCATDGCTVSDMCLTSDTATGSCAVDHCGTDASGPCISSDVCVKDSSGTCNQDLCRQDSGGDCSEKDVCALDLTPAVEAQIPSRNRALRWLYRISLLLLACNLQPDEGLAATVIDAADAVFFPVPTFTTAAALPAANAATAFLRDCDNDGIDEADTNGDGDCAGDPELQDYNNDGSRELPNGTPFAGSFQFRCFYVPSDVALVTSGAVTVAVTDEAAVFGSIDAAGDFSIDAPGLIDLRTSAWLAPAGGTLSFRTAAAGTVDQTQNVFPGDVPAIVYNSVCAIVNNLPAVPVFGALAGWLLAALLVGTAARQLSTGNRSRP